MAVIQEKSIIRKGSYDKISKEKQVKNDKNPKNNAEIKQKA